METTSIALVVVTGRLGSENAAYGAVQNFIDVYDDEVDNISIIGPTTIEIDRENIDQVPIQRAAAATTLAQIVDYICYQLKIAHVLYMYQQQYNAVFFHIGGSMLLIPVLFCKLIGLRSIIFITGSTKKSYYAKKGKSSTTHFIARTIKATESVTCSLSDDVLLLSESMQPPRILSLSSTDVISANFNYINCDQFKKKTRIDGREYDIIFLGRFESVKGIENFVNSISLIKNRHPRIKVKLIGDGKLRSDLESIIIQEGLSEHVSFTSWVDHEEIPNHLNNGRILIMPSESEGIPKTLLEAMACGTIPVAAPVGGIPDIIAEGRNGFLLPDTKPITIAKVVSCVLERDDLEEISEEAQCTIEKEHSYDIAKGRFRRILYDY